MCVPGTFCYDTYVQQGACNQTPKLLHPPKPLETATLPTPTPQPHPNPPVILIPETVAVNAAMGDDPLTTTFSVLLSSAILQSMAVRRPDARFVLKRGRWFWRGRGGAGLAKGLGCRVWFVLFTHTHTCVFMACVCVPSVAALSWASARQLGNSLPPLPSPPPLPAPAPPVAASAKALKSDRSGPSVPMFTSDMAKLQPRGAALEMVSWGWCAGGWVGCGLSDRCSVSPLAM